MQEYCARSLDETISKALKEKSTIFIEGIKGCGKATTAKKFSKGSFWLNEKNTIELTEIDPFVALNGEKPRAIAEFQNSPTLANSITEAMEENCDKGQFILTASSDLSDGENFSNIKEEQIARLFLRPMSLTESRESRRLVSFKKLFDGEDIRLLNKNKSATIQDLAFILCRGGWPKAVTAQKAEALDATKNCCNSLLCSDPCQGNLLRGKKQDTLQHILKSYSMQISRGAPVSAVRDKICEVTGKRLDDKTMASYLETLQALFVTEDLPSWSPKMKSNATPRLAPARYLADPSIATNLLSVTPDILLGDLNYFEMLFKNMCLRDLRVYSSLFGAKLSHYRDNLGLECDVVAHLNEDDWAAINIRLGGQRRIEEAVEDLKKLTSKVAEKKPIFTMLVTATGMCYRRADGVYIVPLNCLTY